MHPPPFGVRGLRVATSSASERYEHMAASYLAERVDRRDDALWLPRPSRQEASAQAWECWLPLCGHPSRHRRHGEDLAPPELSWFSQGFSGGVLPVVPWRALAARRPRICGPFAHAPKRTRTSTRESPDKALNLARLPIPPPAQVGQPGHIGRWRWPSIAPSGAAARLRRAPARRRAGARSRPRGPPARRAPRRRRAPPWRRRARPCPPPRRRSRRRPRCPSRSPSRSR